MKKGVLVSLENKSGQVTLFIIIAVVLVAAGVMIFLFRPDTKSTQSQLENPQGFIESCIKDRIEEVVETISLQGGNYEQSENSYFYLGDHINYLCYTTEYYPFSCVIQQPLLVQHIESEIRENILEDAEFCFDSLVESYENENYEVTLNKGSTSVELLPERIAVNFNNKLTITKGDSQNYERFSVLIESNLYQIASISESMVEWEQVYGEAPTRSYMDWYHNLKIEKKLQIEGTNIYVLTDKEFGGKFQFASRSLVHPPGY